jgi:very-short-patch-repair endonuclease
MSKYNWQEIQKFYDQGMTWRDITNHFGVSQATISLAKKQGKFKSRNKSDSLKLGHASGKIQQKHSEATKQKISRARIKYLNENPDKVPYLINHSSKQSYPEIIFENALKASGIKGWKYNFQIGLYQYDFAFLESKIDVEIDGATHNTDKVRKIDKRRDKFSNDNGWIVIRFPAQLVKKDVIACINFLKLYL